MHDAEVHTNPVLERESRSKILLDIRKLRGVESEKPRVHIGFAGYFNLEMAAEYRPDALLLCDANPKQQKFWNTVIHELKAHESPAGFEKAMRGRALDGCHFTTDAGEEVTLRQEVYSRRRVRRAKNQAVPDSSCKGWLRDPEAYAYMRDLAQHDKIQAMTIDIVNPQEMQGLREKIDAQGYEVGTLYSSNIFEYVQPVKFASSNSMEGKFCKNFSGRSNSFFEGKIDKMALRDMMINLRHVADDKTRIYVSPSFKSMMVIEGRDGLSNMTQKDGLNLNYTGAAR